MSRKASLALVLLLPAAVASLGLKLFLDHGISARDEPTAGEAFVARNLRHLAIPRVLREARNPVLATPEVMASARAHWADHCASCHGNDGRGKTALGQNLYPRAPDMTLPDTQSLSDGEIFAIIENGIRLTGMPAWGQTSPDDDDETWELVHLIRHLPEITPDELVDMEAMNPRSRHVWEQEEAERRFLEGGEAPAALSSSHAEH